MTRWVGLYFLSKRLSDSNRETFVCLKKSQLAGYAIVSHKRKILEELFVEPKFFREGVATELLHTVEDFLLSKQCTELLVNVRLNVMECYKSMGFKSVRRVGWIIGDCSITLMRMRKGLTA